MVAKNLADLRQAVVVIADAVRGSLVHEQADTNALLDAVGTLQQVAADGSLEELRDELRKQALVNARATGYVRRWSADIGDAAQVRGQYVIYRVAEPAVLAAGEKAVTADAFPFAYPDGSHDAAAILVHPKAGTVT